jgi:hypothetical protein
MPATLPPPIPATTAALPSLRTSALGRNISPADRTLAGALNGVDAAFMSFYVHQRGIHIV